MIARVDIGREGEILPEDESESAIKRIEPLNPSKFKLPAFINPNSANNKKTETVKINPFDMIDVKPGVMMSIGGRHKGIPIANRTIKEDGKIRYSKEDYLKMVETKGMQNLALSMKG